MVESKSEIASGQDEELSYGQLCKMKIIQCLRKLGKASSGQIYYETGLALNEVRYCLKLLYSEGVIERLQDRDRVYQFFLTKIYSSVPEIIKSKLSIGSQELLEGSAASLANSNKVVRFQSGSKGNKILLCIKESGASSFRQLCEYTGFSLTQIRYHLRILIEKGEIEPFINEDGIQLIRLNEKKHDLAPSVSNEEIVFSTIKRLKIPTFSQLCQETFLTRTAIRKCLKFLAQEGKIVKVKKRGEHKKFCVVEGNPQNPIICTFCGERIYGKPLIFNIFYPEIIYCDKSCKEVNGPKFSFEDLDKVCSGIVKSTKFEENLKVQSLKEKERIILDFIQNTKKSCSAQQIRKYTGLTYETVRYYLKLLCAKGFVELVKMGDHYNRYHLGEA